MTSAIFVVPSHSTDQVPTDMSQPPRMRLGAATIGALLLAMAAGYVVTLHDWRPGVALMALAVVVDLWLLRQLPGTGKQMGKDAASRRAWLLLIAPVVFAAVDSHAFLRSPGTLKIVLILVYEVVLVLLLLRQTRAKLAPHDLWLSAFVLYMLIGSLYGRIELGIAATILSAAVPLVAAALPLSIPLGLSNHPNWALLTLCWALTFFMVLDTIGMLHPTLLGAVPGAYGHEKAFLAVSCCAGWWLARRWVMLGICSVMLVLLIMNYAAATYPLALVGGVLTLALTAERASARVTGWAFAVCAVVFVVMGVSNLQSSNDLADAYYRSSGKQSNVATRAAAYRAAQERVADSPMTGSMFTGPTTVDIPQGLMADNRTTVSAHSDVLEVTMLGGLVATVLLLAWIAATNLATFRWCKRNSAHAALPRLLLAILNGFFVVGLVNPILDQSGNALILACVVIALRSCLAEAPVRQPLAAPSPRSAETGERLRL